MRNILPVLMILVFVYFDTVIMFTFIQIKSFLSKNRKFIIWVIIIVILFLAIVHYYESHILPSFRYIWRVLWGYVAKIGVSFRSFISWTIIVKFYIDFKIAVKSLLVRKNVTMLLSKLVQKTAVIHAKKVFSALMLLTFIKAHKPTRNKIEEKKEEFKIIIKKAKNRWLHLPLKYKILLSFMIIFIGATVSAFAYLFLYIPDGVARWFRLIWGRAYLLLLKVFERLGLTKISEVMWLVCVPKDLLKKWRRFERWTIPRFLLEKRRQFIIMRILPVKNEIYKRLERRRLRKIRS